ncbi:hypothetical protein V6N13_109428 [Hibiscus sabdariffa]|uniref:Uncharacterized protein n=1 Tax=Hibiscus sabdariffa TaxID=183260 RepID=A0ABR2FPV4_9ROSI
MFTNWHRKVGFVDLETDLKAKMVCFQTNALKANTREGCFKLLLLALNINMAIVSTSNSKLLVILRLPSLSNKFFMLGIDSIGRKIHDDAFKSNLPGFSISLLEPQLKTVQLYMKA